MEKPFYERFTEDHKTWESFQIFLEDLDERLQQATDQILQKASKNPTDYGKEMRKPSNESKEVSVGTMNFCCAEDLTDTNISIYYLKNIAKNAKKLRDHYKFMGH